MRALESAAVGVLLALIVVGAALLAVSSPWFTRTLVGRLDVAAETGLTSQKTAEVAEQVRAFSTGRSKITLPVEVDGRPGFDESAVSHLLDVRAVFVAAKRAALVAALLVLAWLALCGFTGRPERVTAALRVAAAVCLALPVVAGLAGTLDFERLFAAFHGVFFKSGTWTFPPDALLIQVFPEPFWATAAGALAALIALGGIALGLASVAVRRRMLTAEHDLEREATSGKSGRSA